MSKPKPKCVEVYPWLRANLGKGCTAMLTGTDHRALEAAVMIIEEYSYGRDPEVLKAFAVMVRRMQPKCYVFAYHAIAMALDWGDRSPVWSEAGLPQIQAGKCAFEPGRAFDPREPLHNVNCASLLRETDKFECNCKPIIFEEVAP